MIQLPFIKIIALPGMLDKPIVECKNETVDRRWET